MSRNKETPPPRFLRHIEEWRKTCYITYADRLAGGGALWRPAWREASQGMFLKIAALFVIWLVLSGADHPFHVGLGLVASCAVAWLNAGRPDSYARDFPVVGMLWYFPWLLGRVVRSGLHMTALILRPSLPIAPRLIHHRTALRHPLGVAILGNSITLTPGTITAEVREDELVVHAIDDEAGHDLTSRRFERHIARMFPKDAGAA